MREAASPVEKWDSGRVAAFARTRADRPLTPRSGERGYKSIRDIALNGEVAACGVGH